MAAGKGERATASRTIAGQGKSIYDGEVTMKRVYDRKGMGWGEREIWGN